MYTAIIKFDSLADAVRTASKYNNFLLFRRDRFVVDNVRVHLLILEKVLYKALLSQIICH
jgi:hypothetical protein